VRIAGTYSFCNGRDVVKTKYPKLLAEIELAIQNVDEEAHKTKESWERSKHGRLLYSPRTLNDAFKSEFKKVGGWSPVRVEAQYSVAHYEDGYSAAPMNRGAYREMDFVKDRLGVEVQFGKYAFMVYNVCAKMTIFRNLQYIDAGVEIVPMKAFVEHMSSGVSYFEQFVWDLENRGVSDIDIPVLILGIAADWERAPCQTLPEDIVSVSDRVIPAELDFKRTGRTGSRPGPKPRG
jgi:hypothetical protein